MEEKETAVTLEEKNRAVAMEEKDGDVAMEEKDGDVAMEEKDGDVATEEKDTGVSGFVLTNDDALDLESFKLAPRTEAPKATDEPIVTALAVSATPPAGAAVSSTETKKKRGRPRKYGPDGKRSLTLALSPMPISSSIPLTGEYPSWKRDNELPGEVIKKPQRFEYENPGKVPLSSSISTLSSDLLLWLLNVWKTLTNCFAVEMSVKYKGKLVVGDVMLQLVRQCLVFHSGN